MISAKNLRKYNSYFINTLIRSASWGLNEKALKVILQENLNSRRPCATLGLS